MKINVQKIAYHRNGIGGAPFHVVTFRNRVAITPRATGTFVATVFEGEGRCAVLQIDLLAGGTIEFGENSWRGDEFEADLRKAIAAWEKARGEQSVAAEG